VTTPHPQGRTLSLLLLAQLAGLIVPFIMLGAMCAEPGFLHSAAPAASRVQLSLFLLLANGALAAGIALYAFPALRISGEGMACWLVVCGVAWLMLQAVDNTRVMEMVTLSRRFADASGASRDAIEALAPVTTAGRRITHYTTLLAIGSWLLLFYASLWRAQLVPRWIAAVGVVVAALHIGGVSLPVLIGYPATPMVAPGPALSHTLVIVWLLVRGIPARSGG